MFLYSYFEDYPQRRIQITPFLRTKDRAESKCRDEKFLDTKPRE